LKNQIRTPLIDKLVPIVAKIHYVREIVSKIQKSMQGVVMEGRDIGTVIFPNADLKVFMTASLEVRAVRRQLDYQKKGIEIELSEVSKSLQERDKQDMERESCPLIKAEEALLLDTTFTTIDQQVKKIVDWALERAGEG
jgi:cytidylate kinase